jgi:hypothetical protein
MKRHEANSHLSKHQQRVREMFAKADTFAAQTNLVLWQSLALELVSIVGEAGFQSLYQRCLHKVQAQHASLLKEDLMLARLPLASTDEQFQHMYQQFQFYPEQDVLFLSVSLFDCFIELLSSLIGEELCNLILLSAWPAGVSGADTDENIQRPWAKILKSPF